MNDLSTSSQSTRERNELWHRYNKLGTLPDESWRKHKIYQQLRSAGVEQRFQKTYSYQGCDIRRMNEVLRNILIDNGLLTLAEWRADELSLDLDQWFEYYQNFTVKVPPLASREPGKINRKRVKSA